MIRTLIVISILTLLSFVSRAQILGISASKLSAYNTFTVAPKQVEFEPTFGVSRNSGAWDRFVFSGSDTISLAGSINWRMTYGLTERLEFGLNVLSDASYGNFSLKSLLFEDGDFSLGAMVGVGMPWADRTYAHSDPTIDDVSSYAAGLIASFTLDSLSSIDLNVTYQDYFRDVTETTSFMNPVGGVEFFTQQLTGSTFFVNADVGTYVIHERIQLVAGAGYQTSVIDDFWQANLFLESGISVETAENFHVVLAATQSIWGRNSEKSTSVCLSFTTLWD